MKRQMRLEDEINAKRMKIENEEKQKLEGGEKVEISDPWKEEGQGNHGGGKQKKQKNKGQGKTKNTSGKDKSTSNSVAQNWMTRVNRLLIGNHKMVCSDWMQKLWT